MKLLAVSIVLCVAAAPVLTAQAQARRDAPDPRRLCREAIQKSQGLGKDAKVSRKALDRFVANGGVL